MHDRWTSPAFLFLFFLADGPHLFCFLDRRPSPIVCSRPMALTTCFVLGRRPSAGRGAAGYLYERVGRRDLRGRQLRLRAAAFRGRRPQK